jgi:long-chain fatty acid transport protein
LEDASVLWYNPAAMTVIDGAAVSVDLAAVDPSFQFENTGSSGAYAIPGAGDGGNGGRFAVVPQVYALTSLGERWRVGIGLNVPFGLETNYDSSWRGRTLALLSQVKSYNVSPSVAYRIAPGLSLGAGLDYQHFSAELSNFAGPLGTADLKASDSALGFNAGIMGQLPGGTRLDLAYRSPITYKLRGNADFSAGGGAFNSGVQAGLKVPESITAAAFGPITARWDWMANLTWTRWSRVKEFDVIRTSSSALGAAGSTLTSLPFDWQDSRLVALGANYKVNADWMIRFGVARDPTATRDATRTPRLPDQDRTILGLGCRLQPWAHGSFDLGYTHDFVKDASIYNTQPGVPGALVGKFRVTANVLAIQYTQRL